MQTFEGKIDVVTGKLVSNKDDSQAASRLSQYTSEATPAGVSAVQIKQ